jgi:hypothetical protein
MLLLCTAMRRARVAVALMLPLVVLFAVACIGGTADPSDPGHRTVRDTTEPVPIDVRAGASVPTHYKGLPLQLVRRPAPTISAVDGVIGVVCVGMSNANQECARLLAAITPGGPWSADVSPAVRLVNCAVGSHAIERWIDPAYDATLWDACLTAKLAERGIRPEQVRVILHKAANQNGRGPGGSALPLYPDPNANYHAFQRHLTAFAERVRAELPSVQAVYTSSRSYGGFTPRPERGEPQSYEEGQALNQWLSTHAVVRGVWYGWWGYLWAPACTSGQRNGSGVCYDRSDYQADAVHPTAAGEIKIARMLHERLREESWYRR